MKIHESRREAIPVSETRRRGNRTIAVRSVRPEQLPIAALAAAAIITLGPFLAFALAIGS